MSVEDIVIQKLSIYMDEKKSSFQNLSYQELKDVRLVDLGISSLAKISLIMDLEDELSFNFNDDDDEIVEKVEDLVNLIVKKLN